MTDPRDPGWPYPPADNDRRLAPAALADLEARQRAEQEQAAPQQLFEPGSPEPLNVPWSHMRPQVVDMDGNPLYREDRQEPHNLEFFAYETVGGAIGHTAGLEDVDFGESPSPDPADIMDESIRRVMQAVGVPASMFEEVRDVFVPAAPTEEFDALVAESQDALQAYAAQIGHGAMTAAQSQIADLRQCIAVAIAQNRRRNAKVPQTAPKDLKPPEPRGWLDLERKERDDESSSC